jgi:SAM-dependent methyltransferase
MDDGTHSDWLARRTIRTWGSEEHAPALSIPPADEVRGRPSATLALPLPPDHLQARQVGSAWGEAFYREGRVILGQLEAAFAQAGLPLGQARSILDFGCGCGRVLAGFADLPHAGTLWGCDIDAEAIAWDASNLQALAAFRVNPALPPAPFDNGQFDAVYSVSVFTHLPEEMQFAWLAELRRIVRPGGLVVASIHGGHYCRDANAEVRAEVATRGFSYRSGAVTEGLPDFYMVAMHSEAYVRAKWGRFFELVAYHERLVHGVHDAVVLRRTAD